MNTVNSNSHRVFVFFVIFFAALSFLAVSRPFSVVCAQPVSTTDLQPMILTIVASNGTQIVLNSTDIASLPSYRAAGGYKNSVGTLVGPYNYTGVPLTTLLNLVGGITSNNSINAIASDNYTWPLTYDEVTAGNFTTYDPVTGNPVQPSQPLTPMLAYYKDDINLTSEEGPLRLVVVGPEGLLTDSKLWIKWVTTLEVVGGTLSHDVAIINVTSYKTVVGQGHDLNMTVALADLGSYSEKFNVSAYANAASFSSQNVTLSSGNSINVTFTWNTTGLVYGNYTISAYAWPVLGETNTTNNNFASPIPVHVGVPGDVSSTIPGVYDGVDNMKDIAYLVSLFNARPSSINWNPNADVNNDGVVNMRDIAIAILNFNQHE